MAAGRLIEAFTSVQGEGPYVGCRQLFIRLVGCNLACAYCDTDFADVSTCRWESQPGSAQFETLHNPVSPKTLSDLLSGLDLREYHAVSFTGGEPLLQCSFLKEIIKILRPAGWRIYLETNGTLVPELERVISLCDIIAMDIKLPSVSRRPMPKTHGDFLRVAAGREVFVKTVVSERTTPAEILTAARVIRAVDREIPLVIQPVSTNGRPGPISGAHLLILQRSALETLRDVRVIPQTHHISGIL